MKHTKKKPNAHVSDLLDAYIQGETDSLQTEEIERHLCQCESCEKEYRELLQCRQALRDVIPPPSSDLYERILSAIRSESEPSVSTVSPSASRSFRTHRGFRIAVVTAAILMTVSLCFPILSLRRGSKEDSNDSNTGSPTYGLSVGEAAHAPNHEEYTVIVSLDKDDGNSFGGSLPQLKDPMPSETDDGCLHFNTDFGEVTLYPAIGDALVYSSQYQQWYRMKYRKNDDGYTLYASLDSKDWSSEWDENWEFLSGSVPWEN